MRAWQGDITRLAVDAIVNAANEALAPGGGVCGAIHRAAGPELWEACRPLAPVPAGGAVLTPGFRLPSRFVIHAVGPRWQGGGQGEAERLASCYRESLARLREVGGRSIAFPAISTGIFGYPADEATKVAVGSVRDDLCTHGDDVEVVFVCFDDAMTARYRRALGETG
ncbi:MAG: O-acetyl-ADP-ribose deacetylase [Elioraea sp.]|nr:O-acetyl-ADP-ribose deacetylase [Elioraea sp.]